MGTMIDPMRWLLHRAVDSKWTQFLACVLVFLLALAYRAAALRVNHPFWVDEFSTASQSMLLIQEGWGVIGSEVYQLERNNLLSHLLVAGSFLIFGLSEISARLPFAIIGAILPVAFFLFLKKHFSVSIACVSALLIATSYFEITWSVQARGYIFQQLFGVLFLDQLLSHTNQTPPRYIAMALILVTGLLTHITFIFWLIPFLVIEVGRIKALSFRSVLATFSTKHIVLMLALSAGLLAFAIPSIITMLNFGYFDLTNNLWFYHGFLWKELSLVSLLSLLGVILAWKFSPRFVIACASFLFVNLLFFVFLFAHYKTKYLLPVFPYLLVLMAVSLDTLGREISSVIAGTFTKRYAVFFPPAVVNSFIILFLVLNGGIFANSFQSFYSVNKEMREIAVIDYHQVYAPILREFGSASERGEIALVDTWIDRSRWYLKEYDVEGLVNFRWIDRGVEKDTDFYTNDNGDRYLTHTGGKPVRFVGELDDLEKLLTQYPQGFIFIDDSTLPQDVIEYARENFHQELFIDRYQPEVLENPYSTWPATLYSWGFNEPNELYATPSASTE